VIRRGPSAKSSPKATGRLPAKGGAYSA